MNPLPIPVRTTLARRWLEARLPREDPVMCALLSSIDGHRNVIELESFARAIGLDAAVLERLRGEGLIRLL